MILFYYTRDVPYGVFSNFAPYGFIEHAVHWKTAEHYYQAMKFFIPMNDGAKKCFAQIQRASTPKLAAQFGRDRSVAIRSDWEDVKEAVMAAALKRKFEAHASLRDVLLSSGNEILIENSPSDYYWGIGKSGTGKNRLGALLMQLREEMKKTY